MLRKTLSAAIATAMVLLVASCGDDDDDQEAVEPTSSADTSPSYETEDLLIGLAAPNQVYSAVYAAIEKGWFAEESLNAEIVLTQSSTGAVQQAAAGSVHLGAGTPDAAVFGINQGADVSIIATTIQGSPLSVVGGPGVSDWEDLRGETVGVSALKGGEIALLRRLLATKGLNEGDYDVIIAGPTPAKAAALQEGSVAAAVLFSPTDFALEDNGFTILGSTAELPQAEQIPLTVYFVNNAWARENDRGLRVARALYRANQWLLDPANRVEATQIFAEAADQQPEHVAQTYMLWFDDLKIGTPDGMIGTAEIQNVIDMMAQDGDLTDPLPSPDEFLDTSYIEAAVAEGGR